MQVNTPLAPPIAYVKLNFSNQNSIQSRKLENCHYNTSIIFDLDVALYYNNKLNFSVKYS